MFPNELIEATSLFKNTGNKYLGVVQVAANNYPKYFSANYLFISGDQNPRNSVVVFGEFYKIDALLIGIGILAMIIRPRKEWLVLLAWIILAPIPGALSSLTPHSIRGIFMLGAEQLIAAYGLYSLVSLSKNKIFQSVLIILVFIPMFWEFSKYINYYYTGYAKKDAIEWQYGMEQIADFIKAHPEYDKIYMTKERQQPYIFILNYLNYPVYDYLKTVNMMKVKAKVIMWLSRLENFSFLTGTR